MKKKKKHQSEIACDGNRASEMYCMSGILLKLFVLESWWNVSDLECDKQMWSIKDTGFAIFRFASSWLLCRMSLSEVTKQYVLKRKLESDYCLFPVFDLNHLTIYLFSPDYFCPIFITFDCGENSSKWKLQTSSHLCNSLPFNPKLHEQLFLSCFISNSKITRMTFDKRWKGDSR